MTFQFADAKRRIELAMEITGLEVTPLGRLAGVAGTTLSRFTSETANSNISVTTLEKLDEAVRKYVESGKATAQQAHVYYSEYETRPEARASSDGAHERDHASYNPGTFRPRKVVDNTLNDDQITGLDAELLETVVVTVGEFLQERGIHMAPEKRWLVYMTCYRILLKSREEKKDGASINPLSELQDVLILASK